MKECGEGVERIALAPSWSIHQASSSADRPPPVDCCRPIRRTFAPTATPGCNMKGKKPSQVWSIDGPTIHLIMTGHCKYCIHWTADAQKINDTTAERELSKRSENTDKTSLANTTQLVPTVDRCMFLERQKKTMEHQIYFSFYERWIAHSSLMCCAYIAKPLTPILGILYFCVVYDVIKISRFLVLYEKLLHTRYNSTQPRNDTTQQTIKSEAIDRNFSTIRLS